MIKETKPNQFSIYNVDVPKVKRIKAININTLKKTITVIEIENDIEYIQKCQIFYKYDFIKLNEEGDFIFFGVDDDLKRTSSFTINGIENIIFGNAVIVREQKNGSFDRLRQTKLTVEDVTEMITFN